MDAQEALNIILPINKEEFIKHEYSNDVNKCCVLGHLMRIKSGDSKNYNIDLIDLPLKFEIDRVFREKTKKFIQEQHQIYSDIAFVNNFANINGYTEPEIKDRVVHLLEDMVKAGY